MANINEIQAQLDTLKETKAQIKQSIIDKGKEVSDRDSFRSYANKIDEEMYSLIERYFAKFDQLNRFNIKAIQEIGELINLYVVEGISNEAEYNTFAAKQIRKINMDKPQLGYNHWKVILYQSAATSDVFKNYILSLSGKNLQ